MKQSTKNAYQELAKLTGSRCRTCPSLAKRLGEHIGPYRCCDRMFCDMAETLMLLHDYPVPDKPFVGDVPFMGEHGCVVPPEHRPYCTGWVCPEHMTEREFRRQYDRLIDKINQDPDVPPMRQIMGDLAKRKP